MYHDKEIKDVLKDLNTDPSIGLSTSEVHKRLTQYGENELEEQVKISPIVLFLGQFKSFIIYILLFAVIISVVSGEIVDAIVILAILLFNAIFGFIQEYKAEQAINALKKLAAFKIIAMRDGKKVSIDTKELVPGDIIFLEEGTKIPADSRIISSTYLQTMESSLTGESVPVNKHIEAVRSDATIADQRNMLFSCTAVTKGKGIAVVTSTGMQTQIGKIAGLIAAQPNEETPLQKKLDKLGSIIGTATVVICIAIFIVGVLKNADLSLLASGSLFEFFLSESVKEWLLVSVSLAVAAVPEGLPAIVTIALALGVKKMIKKNALIRRLPSVETLGEATVICSDKTGTLTKNEMTVRYAYTNGRMLSLSGEGYGDTGEILANNKPIGKFDEEVFRIGAICNDATVSYKTDGKTAITGDPTEAALIVSARKARIKEIFTYKRVDEIPFDSTRKMMSTMHKHPKHKGLLFTKGAPESVLNCCTHISIDGKIHKLTTAQKNAILKVNEGMASKALRVLGFAYKPIKKDMSEADLIFVGLQAMIDPPREDVKGAIVRCKEAGIRVIMITGDNQVTARAIANEIGIVGEAITGEHFARMSPIEKKLTIKTTAIFARVEPQHKQQIVTILQEQGHVVAMTGDGVNDAPAIKKADLGISMGITGTDVAKEASDMVLVNDDFTSIVDAIEEGRGIFENIKKFVNYLLSCNLGEVFVIFAAIAVGWPLPMTAIMLLWLNLVTDGLPALALSVDPNPKNIMKQPPQNTSEGIMNWKIGATILYVSILITAAVLILFKYSLDTGMSVAHAQTVAFTAIIVMEIVRLQSIRSEYQLGMFSNKWLVMAVVSSIFLQLLVIYTPLTALFGTVPLSVMDWVRITGASAIVYVLTMVVHWVKLSMRKSNHVSV
ncbi:MAG: Ca2+-transporting ATPase [Candidatus Woesearchaeota archaeon]|jgi:Ca2+-transporting ATPase